MGGRTFDAVVFGYYENDRLIYVARSRNGFTPASRPRLMERFRGLDIPNCPFCESAGGEGQGLTKEKDGGLCMAPTDAGRAVRVRGMDAG